MWTHCEGVGKRGGRDRDARPIGVGKELVDEDIMQTYPVDSVEGPVFDTETRNATAVENRPLYDHSKMRPHSESKRHVCGNREAHKDRDPFSVRSPPCGYLLVFVRCCFEIDGKERVCTIGKVGHSQRDPMLSCLRVTTYISALNWQYHDQVGKAQCLDECYSPPLIRFQY